ncbi:MAG: hypothetical protein WC783_05875 [Candidatus Paceibacterota bacterium]
MTVRSRPWITTHSLSLRCSFRLVIILIPFLGLLRTDVIMPHFCGICKLALRRR